MQPKGGTRSYEVEKKCNDVIIIVKNSENTLIFYISAGKFCTKAALIFQMLMDKMG